MSGGSGRVRNLFLLAFVVTATAASALSAPAIKLVSEIEFAGEIAIHGGYSALSLTPDGSGFLALTDKGNFARGRFLREGAAIVGITAVEYGQLLSTKGQTLGAGDFDSEGLALGADGRFYVSFESNDRIAISPDIAAAPSELLRHPDFSRLQNNSAIEALAMSPDGVLMAIPERSGRWERPFPVYRWQDGKWLDTWSIPRIGEYLISDAAFGPDGKLYVLERELALFNLGFSSRVRRFNVEADGIDPGETLLETPFGRHGNLEGLSVWHDPNGNIRLTMISDDNFSVFLSTNFVEYVLEN